MCEHKLTSHLWLRVWSYWTYAQTRSYYLSQKVYVNSAQYSCRINRSFNALEKYNCARAVSYNRATQADRYTQKLSSQPLLQEVMLKYYQPNSLLEIWLRDQTSEFFKNVFMVGRELLNTFYNKQVKIRVIKPDLQADWGFKKKKFL